MRIFRKISKKLINSIYGIIIIGLPNHPQFFKWRNWCLRKNGFEISKSCIICSNVIIIGLVKIGNNSSISNNCFLSGDKSGIFIGDDVMVAPGCVIAAFNHGTDIGQPMIKQENVSKPIYIEDDVWIGANCTITCGVRLGKGCIIGANSAVTKDVLPYEIVGGVPARHLKSRLDK